MATTIQLVSGNKTISLSKTIKPITVTKVEKNITLTHIGGPGPQGEQGIQGEQGDAGVSPTITVGTTTTGDAGSDASVTNSGTETEVTLDFTIPKGDTGANPLTVSDTEPSSPSQGDLWYQP